MKADLTVRAVHLRDMRIDVYIRNRVLPMDYPSLEDADPTPLEVLLASLAACAGNTLNLVLCRKMEARPELLEVEAIAQRREEHPTVLTAIELTYRVRGEGLARETIESAVRIAEDRLCPVLAMLRPGTKVTSSLRMD